MENPADDLQSALNSAFEQAEKQEAPAQEVETSEQPKVAAEGEGRARDEQGRFAKLNEEPEQGETTEPAPTRKAPSSWKPEAQAAFLKADRGEALSPEEIRLLTQEAERRESDYHKGIEGYKTHAQMARAYEEATAPYMDNIRSAGVDGPTAVAKLFHADHVLRHADPATKVQFLAQLARDYNVDLSQASQVPAPDPQLIQLQRQNEAMQYQMTQFQRAREAEGAAYVNSEIERFRADPANVHFNAVKETMAQLLASGTAQDLQSAYDQAVWMRPDIRQSLIEQQRAEAQRQATEQAQAARAKAAAGSVKGSSPAGAGVQPVKGDLRSQLIAAMDGAE